MDHCNCGLFKRPIEDCPTRRCKPSARKRARAPRVLVPGSGDGIFLDPPTLPTRPRGGWGEG